jgi:hypothetical protein
MKNARYRGNAIGNAQNLVVRNILSNLGYESFSEKDWKETKEYFDNKCVYCGSDKNIVCDHAVPINREKLGEHRLGNLVPACDECNKQKGGKDYIEFCNNDERKISRIKEYMESRNYIPLFEDVLKSEKIQIVLQKSYTEIRTVAERYVEMINDLFFDDIFEDELPVLDNAQDVDLEVDYIVPHKSVKSPKKEFILNGIHCDKNKFEENLRKQDSCNVRVTLFYPDKQENRIWQVRNFSINSNLSGNLASGFLRDWKSKGIIGVKLEL